MRHRGQNAPKYSNSPGYQGNQLTGNTGYPVGQLGNPSYPVGQPGNPRYPERQVGYPERERQPGNLGYADKQPQNIGYAGGQPANIGYPGVNVGYPLGQPINVGYPDRQSQNAGYPDRQSVNAGYADRQSGGKPVAQSGQNLNSGAIHQKPVTSTTAKPEVPTNYRQEEKKILDRILDKEVYDRRMRPSGVNSSGKKAEMSYLKI